MRAVDDGALRLGDRVAEWIPEWRGEDRAGVTIRDLLAHSSGLTAYLPYYRDLSGRLEFQHAIATDGRDLFINAAQTTEGTVLRYRTGDASPTPIASKLSSSVLAVDDRYVYVARRTQVGRLDKNR